MQFDAESAWENLVDTDFEVESRDGEFHRLRLTHATLITAPPLDWHH